MNIKILGCSTLIGMSSLCGLCGHKENTQTNTNPTEYNIVTAPPRDEFVHEYSIKVDEVNEMEGTSTADILSESWSTIMTKANHKETKISSAFFQELIRFSNEIKTSPINFTFIMYGESKFNPKAKYGSYLGLIQMDATAFKDCAIRMMEYEQYCKDTKQVTLQEYNVLRQKKEFKKPNIGNKRISFNDYKNLSRERQLIYAEAYLKYRIHENKLNGKKIPSNQLWALIHRPANCKKSSELNERQRKIQKIKNEVKSVDKDAYNKIINCQRA